MVDVSRETGRVATPPEAAQVFADPGSLASAQAYADLLADQGVVRGLIGPREAPRLWDRHIINSALLSGLIEWGTVCDVGSGAGLPGIPLAIARPDLEITLVEPLLRRTTFLNEAVAALGLTNVEVVRARAEELHGHRAFDIVTSRAVAALPKLLGWCAPLVAPGGAVLALKGSSAAHEIEDARPLLRKLKCAAPQLESVEGPEGHSIVAVRIART